MSAHCPHCGGKLPEPAPSRLGGLTHQQRAALDYIAAHIGVTGVSPSYEELAAGLEVKSRSTIHRLILSLEERGRIRRLPGRARAIEIVGAA